MITSVWDQNMKKVRIMQRIVVWVGLQSAYLSSLILAIDRHAGVSVSSLGSRNYLVSFYLLFS